MKPAAAPSSQTTCPLCRAFCWGEDGVPTATSSEDAEQLFPLSQHQEGLSGELDQVPATSPILQPHSFLCPVWGRSGACRAMWNTQRYFHSKTEVQL